MLAGVLSDDLTIFVVAAEQPFSKPELDAWQQAAKQAALALRAAKLAHNLATGRAARGRAARGRGRGGRGRGRVQEPKPSGCEEGPGDLALDELCGLDDEDACSEQEWEFSDASLQEPPVLPRCTDATAKVVAPDLSASGDALPPVPPAAASSSREAPPAQPARRQGQGPPRGVREHRARGVPWGPFFLSPIYQRNVHTGWGAICNMHRDRHDFGSTGCKKSVALGLLGGCNATCVLRLKRWLLAGINDQDWPKHVERSHHVQMGGRGLVEFADGLPEPELDAQLASWLAAG